MEFETDLKIGTLGEQLFSTWCSSAQLGSNRSLEEDRTGWDHQIEFPYIKTDLPRDKQPSPIQCRIQIKSTQRKDRSWSLKASVLKRLIDYSYPTFILFLEFSKDAEPIVENAFLVHIDESIIKKTLKKIRQNDTLKSPKELYEVKVSISYNEKHLLPENSGLAFRNAVLKYVSNGDITQYQVSKRLHLDTIGYDKFGYKFKFETTPEELNQYLTASAIGIVESIDIKNTIMFDNRFNLKNGSVEIRRSEDAKLTISPNVIEACQLRFKESEYSPSINFDADFISIPQVISKTNKLFFRAALFSIELGDLKNSDTKVSSDCKLHLTLEKSVALDEIVKMFKLFHSDNGNRYLILEVYLTESKRTLELQINVNCEFPDLHDVLDAIKVIKDSFEINGSIQTTVDEVYKENRGLIFLARAIQNKVDDFQFEFNNRESETPDEKKIPYSLVLKLGKIAIGAIVLFYGRKYGENTYQAYKSQILQPLVFDEGMPELCIIEKLTEECLSKFNLIDE